MPTSTPIDQLLSKTAAVRFAPTPRVLDESGHFPTLAAVSAGD